MAGKVFVGTVFVGTVAEETEADCLDYAVLRVHTVYEGDVREWELIETPAEASACGLGRFRVGQRKLVFASVSGETSSSSGSGEARNLALRATPQPPGSGPRLHVPRRSAPPAADDSAPDGGPADDLLTLGVIAFAACATALLLAVYLGVRRARAGRHP